MSAERCPICRREDGWETPHGVEGLDACECARCSAACWDAGGDECVAVLQRERAAHAEALEAFVSPARAGIPVPRSAFDKARRALALLRGDA